MADGEIELLTPEETERSELDAGLAGADAIALGVAMDAARYDPELARKAAHYLDEQAALVRLQVEHFEREHGLSTAAAERKRYADRIRNTLATGVLLILAGALFGLAWMASSAANSRQVVVAPFEVAPGLARDVSGKIVAGGVLDELNRLQAATRSSTEKTRLTSGWDGEIKLEVPETGLSIGEISQILRDRFGHDTKIEGDLLETPAHLLQLTVRGPGISPKIFSGAATELDTLIRAAAQYVYGQARPALWAAYLNTQGRYAEAIAFARGAVGRADPVERARLLDMWSDAIAISGGPMAEALALTRAAVRINPADWGAHADIQYGLVYMGDEEAAWHAGESMRSIAGGRPGRAPELQFVQWDQLTWNLPALLATFTADLEATAGAGTNFGPEWAFVPVVEAELHDADAAELATAAGGYDLTDPVNQAARHWARAVIADERGSLASAAEEWQGAVDGYKLLFSSVPALPCNAAMSFERAGRPADADHALAAVGKLKFVDCYRFRAEILDRRGAWSAAQNAFAEAVALAPDLPAAYYSWGMALVRHGNLDAATSKFEDANRRGPHWADPLKAWGDVLAKQGKTQEALAKYDAAQRYAPNWKQLKDARDSLARQKSLP